MSTPEPPSPHDWPDDPRDYAGICHKCGNQFTGCKARIQMKTCYTCHVKETQERAAVDAQARDAAQPPRDTPTPETDAHCLQMQTSPGENIWASADFARKLERELNAATAELEAVRKEQAQLAAWKKSMLAIESEWDVQSLAKMLGAKWGESCRAVVHKRVPEILSELTAAIQRAESAELERDRLKMHNEELDQLAVGAHAAREEMRNDLTAARKDAEEARAELARVKEERDGLKALGGLVATTGDARIDTLRSGNAALKQRMEELRKDADRLDWLQEVSSNKLAHPETWKDVAICGPGNHGGDGNHWLVSVEGDGDLRPFIEKSGPDLRAAIDAARCAP